MRENGDQGDVVLTSRIAQSTSVSSELIFPLGKHHAALLFHPLTIKHYPIQRGQRTSHQLIPPHPAVRSHLIALLVDQDSPATRYHPLVSTILLPYPVIVLCAEIGVERGGRNDEVGEMALGIGGEERVEGSDVVFVEPVTEQH